MRNKGGTIKTLDNGKYLWVGYYKDKNGKVHRPNRTFETKKEAQSFKKSFLISQKEEYELLKTKFTGLTVEDYYTIWKDRHWPKNDIDVQEGKYSFSTVSGWVPLYNKYILPTIGQCKIDNIKFNKYEALLSQKSISDKSVYNINSSIISMLDTAFSVEQIITLDTYQKYILELKNIRKRLNKPLGKSNRDKTVNVMSQDDYKRILDYMYEHDLFYTNLIEFCRETGIRISECVIKESDVKIINNSSDSVNEYGCATINKSVTRVRLDEATNKGKKTELRIVNYTKSSESNREIPLDYYAVQCFKRQIELKKKLGIKSDYVFTTKNGNLIDERNVLRTLHSAIIQINKKEGTDIPIRGLHSLRKLFGNDNIKKNDIKIETISKAMGHASISTTNKYYIEYGEEDALNLAKMMNSKDRRIRASNLDRMKELYIKGKILNDMKGKIIETENDEYQKQLCEIKKELFNLYKEFGIITDDDSKFNMFSNEIEYEIKQLFKELYMK